MTTLLDDIEAEHHETLLEKGNLVNLKKGSHQWTGARDWENQGYIVRVLRATCRACGTQNDSLMGVFHREKNGRGDLREQALDLRRVQFSGTASRVYEPVSVPACLDCLP
jgi:hypothetical protein